MGDSDCQSNTWIINSNDMGGNNGGTTIMQCYMVSKVIQSIIHEKLHDTDFLLLSNSFTHFWTLTMTDIAYHPTPSHQSICYGHTVISASYIYCWYILHQPYQPSIYLRSWTLFYCLTWLFNRIHSFEIRA